VTNNVSETSGGGISLHSARLFNSYIAGNYAFKEGGGVHTGTFADGTDLPVENASTVITDNHVLGIPTEMFTQPSGDGGGLWMSDTNYTKVRNVTIFGNTASSAETRDNDGNVYPGATGLGDNIYFAGGEIVNTVSLGAAHNHQVTTLDENYLVVDMTVTPTQGADIYVADEALLDKVAYSAAQNVTGPNGALTLGPTNVTSGLDDIDVVFADASKKNFRIDGNSPLNNNGLLLTDIGNDITDLRRITPDIGAYTYHTKAEEDEATGEGENEEEQDNGDTTTPPSAEVDEPETEDELGVPNTGENNHAERSASSISLALYMAGFAGVALTMLLIAKNALTRSR
jgi:hypothetical protein